MATLLVTYDLNKAGKDYSGVLEQIKQFPWARLSESSYAVNTWHTPDQLYNLLKPHLDSDDHLLVITLTWPWFGRQKRDVLDWLTQSLGQP